MSATASPSPTTYDISRYRDGFAVLEVYNNGLNRSIVERGFECEAAAEHFIDERIAAERDEAAAIAQAEADAIEDAYQDELSKLYALVNAQGGYVEPQDKIGQARVRAINDVLAFIEKAA